MNTVGDKQVRHRLTQNLSKVPHVAFLKIITSTKSHMLSPKKKKLAFRHQNWKSAYLSPTVYTQNKTDLIQDELPDLGLAILKFSTTLEESLIKIYLHVSLGGRIWSFLWQHENLNLRVVLRWS